MEKIFNLDKINDLEVKATEIANLLEMAKGYCYAKLDTSLEITVLYTAINQILAMQKEVMNDLDNMQLCQV